MEKLAETSDQIAGERIHTFQRKWEAKASGQIAALDGGGGPGRGAKMRGTRSSLTIFFKALSKHGTL